MEKRFEPQPCEGGCDECNCSQYECDYRGWKATPQDEREKILTELNM